MNVINMTSRTSSVEVAPEHKGPATTSIDINARIEDRRMSLTPAEIFFLQELSQMAVDEDQMAILDANLSDPNLFFDSNNRESQSSFKSCPNASTSSMGSARRVKKVETRRASKESRSLKQAAMKIIAINRFASGVSGMKKLVEIPLSASSSRRGSAISNKQSPATSRRGSTVSPVTSRRGSTISIKGGSGHCSKRNSTRMSGRSSTASTIRAIMEDLSFASSDEEGSDQEEKLPEDHEDYEVPLMSTAGGSLRDLLTRRASVNAYGGEGFEIGAESIFELYAKHYDPWEVTTDPDGNPFEFHVIGADSDDMDCQPLVLSPPQMHSLQEHLPFSKQGESLWLKYSLVRDGACKTSFLKHLRSEQFTLMAMETVDGEVFGAFTAAPWHIQHGYFGTAESFVWRLKCPRDEEDDDSEDMSYEERDRREREIEVFKHSFQNNVAQICSHDRIAVGGGTASSPRMVADGTIVEPNQFGFAISFDGSSLLEASSSPSITFNSPGLSKQHEDGSKFELLNLEVWALTPCITVQEAQRMACQKLFLERNSRPMFARAKTV